MWIVRASWVSMPTTLSTLFEDLYPVGLRPRVARFRHVCVTKFATNRDRRDASDANDAKFLTLYFLVAEGKKGERRRGARWLLACGGGGFRA